jgi:hypothetical protein
MAKPVTISDLSFASKKSAFEYIRKIRDSYPDGAVLDHSDDLFIRWLLALHTEATVKIGCGISHFTVATEKEFGGKNRHFVLHRHDGCSSDFSFLHCLSPESKDRNDRLMALRQAIKEQIWSFRDRELISGKVIICPYEQVPITRTNCQIDHQAPRTFEALTINWLVAQGIGLVDVKITPPADNQLVAQMADAKQMASWKSFHAANAELRLLSSRGNLSGARRN